MARHGMNAQSQQISCHPPGADFRETPGRIKAFASDAAVAEYLPLAWLTALRAASSSAAVALSAVDSAEVAEAALTGAADIGLVEGPGVPDGLRAGPVGRDTLTVVVAPSHP
jgi:DNA-binding transcriptional LysR family regulator